MTAHRRYPISAQPLVARLAMGRSFTLFDWPKKVDCPHCPRSRLRRRKGAPRKRTSADEQVTDPSMLTPRTRQNATATDESRRNPRKIRRKEAAVLSRPSGSHECAGVRTRDPSATVAVASMAVRAHFVASTALAGGRTVTSRPAPSCITVWGPSWTLCAPPAAGSQCRVWTGDYISIQCFSYKGFRLLVSFMSSRNAHYSLCLAFTCFVCLCSLVESSVLLSLQLFIFVKRLGPSSHNPPINSKINEN
jgi:hypothetical protein